MHSTITEGAAKELGRSIRFIRQARALTLRDVAKGSGLSPQYLGQIELAQRLGISEARLAGLRAAFETRFGADVWREYSLDHQLPRLPGRVLLVHDRDDVDASYANSLYLRFLREDAALHATHGLGHNRVLHDPGVTAAVRDFLTPQR